MKEPLSVTALTFAIKNHLETTFRSLSVQGEITNFKPHSSGHLYFDLKDEGAKIPAVFFKADRASLSTLPKDGDQVIVEGTLTVYPPHGKYQLIVNRIQLKGVGELLYKFHELKKKLDTLGWFAKERKKPLPKFPEKIGVVTSPTGAVIRDIIHILTRRSSGFHLLLNPVRVQGEGAAAEIAQAIRQFNKYKLADVLIVGRGGGSLEDLWPFNEEIVAQAIFESAIPIISAVGHETDVTLADFVADVRAPTPSAAAEIVLAEEGQYHEKIEKFKQGIKNSLLHQTLRHKEKLKRFTTHPLLVKPLAFIGLYYQKIDDISYQLNQRIKQKIVLQKEILAGTRKQMLALRPSAKLLMHAQKMDALQKAIDFSFNNLVNKQKYSLQKISENLIALDPKNVLKRGYSILFHQKMGSVIVSAQQLVPGTEIRALFSDGEGLLTVKEQHE